MNTKVLMQTLENGKRVFMMVWKEKKWLFGPLFVGTFLVSVAPYVQSWLRGLLLDQLIGSSLGGQISVALLTIFVVSISFDAITKLISNLNQYLSKLVFFYVDATVEMSLIKKRGEIDLELYENPAKLNEFNKVMDSGTWRVRNFTDRAMYVVTGFFEVLAGALSILYYDWHVFLLIFFGSIPSLLVEMKYGRDVWGIQTANQNIRRRYWNLRWHFFNLPYLVELKLYKNIEYFIKQIKDLYLSFQEGEKLNENKKIRLMSLATVLSQTAVAVSIYLIIISVVRGNISVGIFTFLGAAIAQLKGSLSGFFMNIGLQFQDSLYVSDYFNFLETKPVLKMKQRKAYKIPKTATPSIEFENVSFKYPESKDFVLKNINLKITAGAKVALIGVNGAGKTTIVKLLCRFYDPTEGRILVDGYDLRDVDLASWYEILGIIFQDYATYDFTVRDAIALGRTEKKQSVAAVKRAAKAAEADVFIENWSDSYHQQLGREFDKGIEPSIGQWQKLALARTFYRDPRVMILDEPTSSIDAEAEAKIFERIEQMSDGRTVILISHRFSTVRQASEIVVFKDGSISECGTHERLMEINGTYARLFKLQAAGYK